MCIRDSFNGGIAVVNISQTVFTQGGHAHFNGLLLQHHGGRAVRNHVPQGIVDIQKLVDPLAALVAGVGAFVDVYKRQAKRVLQRRVDNSPPAGGEARWLAGWRNRCDSYKRSL